MIRTLAQLTDPAYRERFGLAGDRPIFHLERPAHWGIHIDEQTFTEDDRPYIIRVGESGMNMSAVELVALAVDVLTRLAPDLLAPVGGTVEWGNLDPDDQDDVWPASIRAGDTDEALARRRSARWPTAVLVQRRIGPWTKAEGTDHA